MHGEYPDVQLLDCSGAGFAITSETVRAGRAEVPPTGDCAITVPFDLLDVCWVTFPTSKPAFLSARFAFARVLPTTLGIFGSGLAIVSVMVSPSLRSEPAGSDWRKTVPFGAEFVSLVSTLTLKPAASSSDVATSTDFSPTTSGTLAPGTEEGGVASVIVGTGDGEPPSASVSAVSELPTPAAIRITTTAITQNHQRFQNGVDLRRTSGGGGNDVDISSPPRRYRNSHPSHRPVALPTVRRAIRFPTVPFFTAFTSPIRRASVYRRPRVVAMACPLFAASTVVISVEPVSVAPPDAVDDARSRVPGAIPAAAVAVHV